MVAGPQLRDKPIRLSGVISYSGLRIGTAVEGELLHRFKMSTPKPDIEVNTFSWERDY
jgi:hypothetical protein